MKRKTVQSKRNGGNRTMVKRVDFENLDVSVQTFLQDIEDDKELVVVETKGKPMMRIASATGNDTNDPFAVMDEIWADTKPKNISENEADRVIAEAMKSTTGRQL
jgi:hypothetical protein